MASSEPLFLSSTEDLQQRLKKVPKTLQNLVSSRKILKVCIFKLPETRTSEKPECYIPQHIGLGPLHHFRTDIYSKQERFKLVAAFRVLKACNITSELENIIQESLVNSVVPVADYYYDFSYNLDTDVLTWVFAIDALVLIHVLSEAEHGRWREFMEDVIMIENQIPLMILIELGNALRRPGISIDLEKLLVNFCKTRSPFKFLLSQPNFVRGVDHPVHLLDYMYQSIFPCLDVYLKPNIAEVIPGCSIISGCSIEQLQNSVETAGQLFPCLDVYLKPILLILKFPWDKITTLINEISGETPAMLEIDIPSVSLLTRIAKIKFFPTDGGIREIEFDKINLTFCLPVLDLKADSEVILRNLVAYEESRFKNGTGTNLVFTEYVDLMCGIVDGVEDVKILREKEIIVGDMENEKVVKLFNGITKSSVKVDGEKSELLKTIEKVNNHYGNIPRIKVFRSAKKLFLASWKTILVVFSVLSLLLSTYVGVNEFYDQVGLGKARLGAPPNNNLLDF